VEWRLVSRDLDSVRRRVADHVTVGGLVLETLRFDKGRTITSALDSPAPAGVGCPEESNRSKLIAELQGQHTRTQRCLRLDELVR
jgi:hypothetical protein